MHEGREVMVNPFYQSDFNYSIQVNRWLFKLIGAWPRSFIDIRIFQILQNALVCLCYICFIYISVPNMLHVIFEEDDVEMQIRSLLPILAWFMTFVKYCFLLIHSNDLHGCLKQMENDWLRVDNSMNRDIMLSYAKIGRYVAALSAIWLYLGSISYLIIGSTTQTFVHGNETVLVKRLPFAFYSKLINPTISPTYEILLVIQIFADFFLIAIIANTNSLAFVFVLHVSGQIMILKRFLSCLNQEKKVTEKTKRQYEGNKNVVKSKIAIIVRQHVRVIKFIQNIEKIMNQICLAEFLGSIFIYCFLGFLILKEWEQKNFKNLLTDLAIFVSATFNIFVLCFTGEILLQKCKEVGEKAYTIAWYRLPGKASLDLLLVILMSNCFIRITAGKFVNLSLPSFSYVLRSAAVYLNLLLSLTTY
ncbi:odorant receptor 10-like [Prorops nasuta]|uniref:odorant receptor 10-like n=1 Tax=Prorops nasuta TaxID=863751 RepID=UPI0034CD797F